MVYRYYFSQKFPFVHFGAAIKLDEIKVLVISGSRPDMNAIIPDTPSEVIEKMQRCWQEDPNERPTSLGKPPFFLPFSF